MLALLPLMFAAVALARCPQPDNGCHKPDNNCRKPDNDRCPDDPCTVCKFTGVSLLTRDKCSSHCFNETPNELVGALPCSITIPGNNTAIIGSLVCHKEVCELSALDTRTIREANAVCSNLSPIAYRFDPKVSPACLSYLRNKNFDEGCKDCAKAYCYYPQISDTVGTADGPINLTNVYRVKDDQLLEIQTTPFLLGGATCPDVDGVAPIASWCLSTAEPTPVAGGSDLAALMEQNFSCPCDSVKRILNGVVGCYRSKNGPRSACPTPGTVAKCFYPLPSK